MAGKRKAGDELTERQKRFCDEYLMDLNGTRAYMEAYPATTKEATAAQGASRLLRNVKVAAYVQARMRERQERVNVSQDEVLRGIMAVAFGTDDREKEEDGIEPRERLRALELLGRHLGMFEQKKDSLDREEQRARIAKLKADTREKKPTSTSVTVRFVNTEEGEA